MASSKTSFIFLLFVVISSCTEQLKQEADDLKCKGVDVDISSDTMMIILECAQKLNVMSKADLTPEKKPCFAKCMTEKQGLVDEAGKLHKEKIDGMVDSSLPVDLANDVKMHLGKCIDEHGTKINPKDETCRSYEPLTECVHKAFLHLCTGN